MGGNVEVVVGGGNIVEAGGGFGNNVEAGVLDGDF